MRSHVKLAPLVILVLWPAAALAAEPSATAVDHDVENPLGKEWVFKLQNETYLLQITEFDAHEVNQVLQLQPRLSFPLGEQFYVVARPKFLFFDSIPYKSASDTLARNQGLGDLELPIVLSLNLGPHWIEGIGPTFTLPTATTPQTGAGKWQAGPAVVLGWQTSRWMAALLAQQWWSFAGESSRASTSKLNIQYFLARYFAGGWSIGMSPTISVDWKAAQAVTLPIGLGAARTFVLGDTVSLQLGAQALYMIVRPDNFGQQAQFELTVAPVLERL